MNTRNVILAITPLALACAPVFAAQRVDLMNQDLGKLNRQFDATVAQTGVAAKPFARHAQLIGLDSESRLVAKNRHTSLGVRNSRYQQTFRGIPVFGEHVVVSEDDSGQVRALFGRKIEGLASEIASVAPKLSKAQALSVGKRSALGARSSAQNEQAELNIYVDESGRAHLAYVVSFFAVKNGEPTLPKVIVDANDGRVLKQWENLQTANGTGPGGNEKTGQYEFGTDFGYLNVAQSGTTCKMENDNVKTVNLNHSSDDNVDLSTKAAYSYTCPRNTVKAINGAYSPLNDAHYFGGVVFDMYKDYMQASPLPEKLLLGVHFSTSYENASWIGNGMLFGDGKTTFYPLVSLDVLSHEVSHGYTQFNSGLNYDNYAPGALNEAFSDIAGEAAEYFMLGSNDFKVGAQIFKGDGALRYMATPRDDGRSIDHVNQMPAGGINNHLGSGIYNKAFYTLATKAGWNTKTAFQAFARANRDYWTASTTFNEGGAGVLRAACDMGMKGQDVVDAFKVVGINAGALPAGCGGTPANTPPVANFTSAVSGLKVTFTDKSTDSDGTIASRSWNFGDGTTSTATSPSKTYTAAGTYTVTLTVKDDDGASHTKTASVTVTAPPSVQTYSNTTDYAINDRSTVDSPITVSGRTGNAPSNASVTVNIVHTYIADLKVDLVAPDGSLYNIHNHTGGSADNINKTVTFNLSSETLNGTWKLRVYDYAGQDTGKIDSWSVKF
ncbi:M4 family metallopeptidase [Lysobacter sp. TAB13]|uniref:M4 family metallopeptidase n=1 Tax=Lysobacter sp. TAB13 TaxID=3233065 RepID=UPI003F94BD6B